MSSSGGSAVQVASQTLRKSFTASALIVGVNPLAVVAGGVVRIDSLVLRVTAAFTSAGAPTLAITSHAAALTAAAIALANLTLGAVITRATMANALSAIAAGVMVEAQPGVAANSPGGMFVSSDFAGAALGATVAVALYTGGTLELDAVWAPMTSGATLT